MNKKTLACLLALVMTALCALSSCALAEEPADAAIDPQTVIATAGDLSITYDEVYALVRTTINDYANYYQQYYGYQVDTADEEFQRSIAELVGRTPLLDLQRLAACERAPAESLVSHSGTTPWGRRGCRCRR